MEKDEDYRHAGKQAARYAGRRVRDREVLTWTVVTTLEDVSYEHCKQTGMYNK